MTFQVNAKKSLVTCFDPKVKGKVYPLGFYWVELSGTPEPALAERRVSASNEVEWVKYPETITNPPTPAEQIRDEFSVMKEATPSEIASAKARVATEAEKIADAIKHLSLMERDEHRVPKPPARRLLKVGDEVVVGNLADCKVVALAEEGRVVVFTFKETLGRIKPVTHQGYRAMNWYSVLLKKPKAPSFGRQALLNSYTTNTLSGFLSTALRGLEFNPDYQRGYAWSDSDKEKYLASVLQGRELGRFIIVNQPYPMLPEVLDGKQRLSCLLQFFLSEIPCNGVYWDELSFQDQNIFESRGVQVANLSSKQYSRADLLQIFLEVNAAGVPQTEEHLSHVRELLAAENR
ncbi:DUF262 domain-containing protein, partial [Nostoc sp. CHAB 5834]|nr:DUF262 domain-containing protein [Nostoc sp. CHAB 5834]